MTTTETMRENTELDELRGLIDELERVRFRPESGLTDSIRDAVNATDIYKVRGGATFTKDERARGYSVSVKATTSTDWQTRAEFVSSVELTVYGTMTYKDRTDSAAVVTLRSYLGDGAWSDWSAWTRANAWNGRAYVEMPDGARQGVADAVLSGVAELGIDRVELAAESRIADRAARRSGKISEAFRALRDAVNA